MNTVDALSAGDLVSIDNAEITGTNIFAGSESASADRVMVVAASSPIDVSIEMNPDPAVENGRLRMELLVSNRGGITLNNVLTVASCGIDRISVGAVTHSAIAVDIGLDR